MLGIAVLESPTAYQIQVSDSEENTFMYEFSKQAPEGVIAANYLQSCKREAQLLAELAIAQKQPPTPIEV